MGKDGSKGSAEQALFAGEAWLDPLEAGLRERIRGFIEELAEQELEAALGRGRYERGGGPGRRDGPPGGRAGRSPRPGGDAAAPGPRRRRGGATTGGGRPRLPPPPP